MIPRHRCSSTNLWHSVISSCVRGSSLPRRVVGAPGRSLMAWSHIVCCGSHWECSSLKILAWWWYSAGILLFACLIPLASVVIGAIVTFPMYICSCLSPHVPLGRNWAFAASGVRRIIGNWVWLIHPRCQSIFGWTGANHGYPRMAFCLPSLVRKKQSFVWFEPVRTDKLV